MTSDNAATFRTMYVLTPPPHNPHSWDLTFERFTQALKRREPQAPTERSSGVFLGEMLSFNVTTSTGQRTEGMASVEPAGFTFEDCTPAEGAELTHWLRETVLPPDAEVDLNTTEGIEWQLPALPVPPSNLPELEAILTTRVEETLRHEEQQLR